VKVRCYCLLAIAALMASGCAGKSNSGMLDPIEQTSGQGLRTPMAPVAKPEPKGVGKLVSGVKSAVKSSPSTPDSAADPLSLNNKSEPNVELFVVMAQMHERSGNLAAAEEQYKRALEKEPKSLDALLAYARMQDRQGNFAEADRLYRQAIEYHPKDATVRNDYGLCLARQSRLDEAAGVLQSACQLKPTEARYRNNLAMVLVEMNQLEEAYLQLADVHQPAVAYYNVGYLLMQRQQYPAARHHFEQALKHQPNFPEASHWLATMPAGNTRVVQQPAGAGSR
jgi:Tfp pilus assembly protein PilF